MTSEYLLVVAACEWTVTTPVSPGLRMFPEWGIFNVKARTVQANQDGLVPSQGGDWLFANLPSLHCTYFWSKCVSSNLHSINKTTEFLHSLSVPFYPRLSQPPSHHWFSRPVLHWPHWTATPSKASLWWRPAGPPWPSLHLSAVPRWFPTLTVKPFSLASTPLASSFLH